MNIKAFSDKLYRFSCHFVSICSLLLTGLLFISAFLFTCYATDMETQLVLTGWDNPLFNLLGLSVFLLLFWCIRYFLSKNSPRRKKMLLGIVLIWCVLLGGIMIVFGRTMPSADPMSVFSMAEELAAGNTAVIHPTDSYISYYPQQIGLIAFYEIIIRIWNLLPFSMRAFPAIQCLYVLLACVIILFQYKTVHLFWEDDTADCLYLLLIGANLPFFMYTSFVYGEIPSFAMISIGFYYAVKLWKLCREDKLPLKPALQYGAFSLLALTASVLLRKNSLIMIIAVVLVTFFQWIGTKKHFLPGYMVLCIICSMSILPMFESIYEHRSGSKINSGVPAITYFAMGMQESSRGCGWYNGFNFNTYQSTGLDREATSLLSRQAIARRLTYFKQHPGYTADFYGNKFLSQWADGSYACRQATLATYGGRSEVMSSLYGGNLGNYFISYCNAYQNLLYLGAFLFCIFHRKEKSLPMYLGLIGGLGGFLFHMLWEANSRYIFLYSLLLLPYAAQGWNRVYLSLEKRLKKAGDGNKERALL